MATRNELQSKFGVSAHRLELSARRNVNSALFRLSRQYHDGLPIAQINAALTTEGFEPLADGIYTGNDGRTTEYVGENTWVTFCWYRMPSGRWEVTLYAS